jgi:hypothetical protein
MVERRTIGIALATLSPEAQGFIQSGEKPAPSSKPSTVEVEVASSSGECAAPLEQQRQPSHRRTRARVSSARVKVEVPDSWKVPITTKLEYATVQALRRAYLEQKLSHATPNTQQEIIEEAVQAWLKRNGFLTEGPDCS